MRITEKELNEGTFNKLDFNFSHIPEYYQMEFKGRPPKYCPRCKRKMKYDGWGSDGTRIDEYWVCKKCEIMFENPD